MAISNGCKNDGNFCKLSLPLRALTFCWDKGRFPSLFPPLPPLPIPWPQEFPSSSVENTKGINFLSRCSAPFSCPPWTMLRRALRFTNASLFSKSLTVSCGACKKQITCKGHSFPSLDNHYTLAHNDELQKWWDRLLSSLATITHFKSTATVRLARTYNENP